MDVLNNSVLRDAISVIAIMGNAIMILLLYIGRMHLAELKKKDEEHDGRFKAIADAVVQQSAKFEQVIREHEHEEKTMWRELGKQFEGMRDAVGKLAVELPTSYVTQRQHNDAVVDIRAEFRRIDDALRQMTQMLVDMGADRRAKSS